MKTIKWIHLSDLHFGDDSEFSKQSRVKLLEYLKNYVKNIDYLFVTGDFIYAKNMDTSPKKEAAFLKAKEYLEQLYITIWQDDVFKTQFKNRVFIVPGNHDIIRNKSRSATIDGMKEDYRNNHYAKIDYSFIDAAHESMKCYYGFYNNLIGEDLSDNKNHYVVSTDEANIFCINTCLSSGNDFEEGSLILDSELLFQAVENIDTEKPTIVIAHHSLDCLDKEEQKKVEVILKDHGICLYLCGHSHERESNIILRYDQKSLLNSFTAGTLTSIDGKGDLIDTVFFIGEMDPDTCEGNVFAHKWTFADGWHEDKEFGLVQGINNNYRFFKPARLESTSPLNLIEEKQISNPEAHGVYSRIVPHISRERSETFLDVNEKASKSLSVYGIGITHVSKDKNLLTSILKEGGTVRLCMVDPDIFKNDVCKNDEPISGICNIDFLNFCIYSAHMSQYIRDEYVDDIKRSYERVLKYQDSIKKNGWDFRVRKLQSFVPISINIVNEVELHRAELIAEYNMPFVEKRLLIRLSQSENPNYYSALKEVYEKIWDRSKEV